jgi:hypothetical protein
MLKHCICRIVALEVSGRRLEGPIPALKQTTAAYHLAEGGQGSPRQLAVPAEF